MYCFLGVYKPFALGNFITKPTGSQLVNNEFINNSVDSHICNEAIGEDETNCKQLDSLDEDVFSKALDMLTDIWETNQR